MAQTRKQQSIGTARMKIADAVELLQQALAEVEDIDYDINMANAAMNLNIGLNAIVSVSDYLLIVSNYSINTTNQ